jgi:hypothetical protein
MCGLQRGIGMVPTSEWWRHTTRLVADLQGYTYDLEQNLWHTKVKLRT